VHVHLTGAKPAARHASLQGRCDQPKTLFRGGVPAPFPCLRDLGHTLAGQSGVPIRARHIPHLSIVCSRILCMLNEGRRVKAGADRTSSRWSLGPAARSVRLAV